MNGGFGFGRSGFGRGGGGTRLGHDRYRPLRHDRSRLGHGLGLRRRRWSRRYARSQRRRFRRSSIGQPNAQGDLDKAIIRRYIKRNIQKITYCYEKQLLAKPGLAGTVSTQFFITPNGNVAIVDRARASTPRSRTASPTSSSGIEFPKPKGGGGVQVNYPFTFRPAGQ